MSEGGTLYYPIDNNGVFELVKFDAERDKDDAFLVALAIYLRSFEISQPVSFCYIPTTISKYQVFLFGYVQTFFSKEIKEIRPVINLSFNPCIDQLLYLNSSIWQFFVNLGETISVNTLQDTLTCVNDNYATGLYQLNVAWEYAEFQGRLVENSYINNTSNSGHNLVQPFKFHDEHNFTKRLSDKLTNSGNHSWARLKNYSWKILLVDDKGQSQLTRHNNLSNNETVTRELSKYRIIEKRVSELFAEKDMPGQVICKSSKEDPANRSIFCFDFATTIHDAIEMLKKDSYDIIMLDYLLLPNARSSSDVMEMWGTHLLHKINQLEDIKKQSPENSLKKGPLDFLWICPITAFNTAFMDDVTNAGIPYFNKTWYMTDGADPINTPELFKYKFAELLDTMVGKAGLDEINAGIREFRSIVHTGSDHNIYDFFMVLLMQPNVKESVFRNFKIIMEFYSNFKTLDNNRNNSAFCAAALKNIYADIHPKAFLQLINLMYTISFGTRLQARQMWEEYKYLLSYYPLINMHGEDSPTDSTIPKYQPMLKKIGNHISKLVNS